ncbi:MAG: hypothetical protein IT158_03775 [Bryobacterales bacterium]|nr:hypothetical protein [Bryobacterales bacterium]
MRLNVLPPATSRRSFLAACAGCAAGAACPALAAQGAAAAFAPAVEKPKIRLVFTHITPELPTWPYQGYDYEGRKKELTARLRQSCPFVEFLPVTAGNPAEARRILVNDAEVDGYLVYMIGIWTGVALTIAASNRPTLFVDDLYGGSGEFLTAYAAARRKGLRVAPVSSSRFEDVVQSVRAFDTLKRLQASAILDVSNRPPGANGSAIQDVFGTTVKQVTGDQISAAYEKADRSKAQTAAARWMKEAKRIVEPGKEEILKSAVMYVAMEDLLREHKAQAVAIDCLSLFYANKLAAYPCLGLFQFNNDGLVGACEADLPSTITMLMMSYLTGRPGYISDPVIDTSKNQIIYAHCVAPSKVFGPEGPSNPYHIRSHSEDRKGASVRSLMPLGEMTTTLEVSAARREIVFHQGKAVANIDDDKACRTKLAVEVKDVYKLLGEWDRWGWHRVTFYGDLRQPVETMAALLGFKLIEEG